VTILDNLADAARRRVAKARTAVPLEAVRARAAALAAGDLPFDFPFAEALKKPGLSFICEVKRASPSRGVIAEHFPYLEIARAYEAAGADAVSVLTEPERFLGRDEYLRGIAGAVKIPALRKDFTVDAYQIYEAKTLGAAAVLLICAILGETQLREYIALARSLGLDALVEAHTEPEVAAALAAGADIVGVNSRDLRTFEVDLGAVARLRALVPPDRVFVAESGIRGPEDVRSIAASAPDAVLIGEAMMRSGDKRAFLSSLRGAV
jgi:indole-3-glycerol phosphate synthase